MSDQRKQPIREISHRLPAKQALDYLPLRGSLRASRGDTLYSFEVAVAPPMLNSATPILIYEREARFRQWAWALGSPGAVSSRCWPVVVVARRDTQRPSAADEVLRQSGGDHQVPLGEGTAGPFRVPPGSPPKRRTTGC